MKISVVMQSYLGDYPNSRINPEYKFVRAVNSFLAQKHEDKELIIVSDGCEKTKKLYEILFSHKKNIKFVYLSKKTDEHKMCEIKNNIKYFRGVPRKIGVNLADCDIVTYLDSDDIILPNRLSDLEIAWHPIEKSIKWASNPLRYIHKNALENPLFLERKAVFPEGKNKILNIKNLGYDVSEDDLFFLNESVERKYVLCATYAFSHRKNISVEWKDTTVVVDESGNKISGNSEDNTFLISLQHIEGPGFRQESESYVVCHYPKIWDI